MITFIVWLLGCALLGWLDNKYGPRYGEIIFLWGIWTIIVLIGHILL